MKLPVTVKPEHVTAIVDTREQHPLCLDPLQVEVGTLVTGDYSIRPPGARHRYRAQEPA